jgi:hypothetical protein
MSRFLDSENKCLSLDIPYNRDASVKKNRCQVLSRYFEIKVLGAEALS